MKSLRKFMMKFLFNISGLFKRFLEHAFSNGKRSQFPVFKRAEANAMPALTSAQLHALLDAEDTSKPFLSSPA